MLPLKWEAIKRVVDFLVQVMRMNDDRLVKVVMLEALELGSKVRNDTISPKAILYFEPWEA